jgi:hypothetical protein
VVTAPPNATRPKASRELDVGIASPRYGDR